MKTTRAHGLDLHLVCCALAVFSRAPALNAPALNGAGWRVSPAHLGERRAAVEWDPDGAGPLERVLVVAGHIPAAGNHLCSNVAVWDGAAWSDLGGGLTTAPGNFDRLASVVVWQGSLFASGASLRRADGTPLGPVARWDGTAWQSFGSMTGECDTLAVIAGEFYGSGVLSVDGGESNGQVVKWDGTAWQTAAVLHDGGQRGQALFLLDVGGSPVIAGGFDDVDGTGVHDVAAWNGSAWTDIGPVLDGQVISAAVLQGTPVLLVFENEVGVLPLRLVNGSWTTMPLPYDPANSEYPNSITVVDGSLYATTEGLFGSTGTVDGSGVKRWNGSIWETLGAPIDSVMTLTSFRGTLVAGGSIQRATNGAARGVAQWDGASWQAFGEGMSGTVQSLNMFRGQLIAHGNLHTTDPLAHATTMRWDGAAWTPLGPSAWSGVAVYQNDLILSGTAELSRFNGVSTIPIGPPGVQNCSPIVVDGVLYCLTTSVGAEPDAVFRLDAGGWTRLGENMTGHITGLLGHAGNLYLFGWALRDGAAGLGGVERWDGQHWVDVGNWRTFIGGYSPSMVASYQGQLIANVPSNQRPSFAAWNGSAWTFLPPTPYFRAQCMVEVNGELLAGGAGSGSILAWNGAAWRDFAAVGDTGYDVPYVNALALFEGDLVVGGSFISIGGELTNLLARIRVAPCCGSADFNGDGDPGTDQDISAFFACLAGSCCPTCGSVDFNSDGDVGTDQDIDAFFRVLSGGSC